MEPVYYRKNKNVIFPFLEENLGLENPQNYIPIYDTLFSLNENNKNTINLNNKWELSNIHNKMQDRRCQCNVSDINNNTKKVEVFFKFAPLMDPVKYLIGKYNDCNIETLPLNDTTCNEKLLDVNNSAYIDNYFSYLSSRLLHEYGFVHGIDYYGGFLAIKENYIFNSEDDIDYIHKSSFFKKSKDHLFTISDDLNEMINNDSTKNKDKLKITDNNSESIDLGSIIEIDTLDNLKEVNPDEIVAESNLLTLEEINKNHKSTKSSSTCSSRSSITDDEDNDEDDEDNDGGDDDDDSDEDDTDDEGNEESYNILIKKFPVNVIALEACNTTFDELIENDLSYAELISAFMQIIMTLIGYQKAFNLTHNDLHTNNIMYVPTEKQYLYYCFENKYYKVPTYNRIYKIIDFGRAIYKYNGNLHCSDSFSMNGDAATQYNCEPYLNDQKPRLEPNYSFDLCRLACSLYDNLVDDDDDEDEEQKKGKKNKNKNKNELYNPVKQIIEKWCTDDKGRNILYKKNGDERYPEFKLYKMIARTVHNLVPKTQLEDEIFKKYNVSKKSVKKNVKVVDIDSIPSMV